METSAINPEHLTEWRKEFEKTEWSTELKRDKSGYANNYIEGVWQGYLRACTHQATEIAALKAKLATIKGLVCGDAAPRWDNSPQTTYTRGRIADLCELPNTKLLKG
jgi:hypothetical protein